MPPVIDADTCVPCAVCVEVCPEDVFFGSSRKEVPQVTYPAECYHCGACVTDCPTEAISLFIPLPLRLSGGPSLSYGKSDEIREDRECPTSSSL